MLILLQPGIQPLGQFDMKDSHVSLVKGGEVAAFEALTVTDGYAADVSRPGPQVQLSLGEADSFDGYSAAQARPVWGLVDEGSSAGLGGRGYGTMFGQVIGATVGQGTGVGTLSTSGVVVVGPSTILGSGKATLWTKPGLYGVTSNAWADPVDDFDGAGVNALVFGHDGTGDASLVGKLSVGVELGGSGAFGDHVAYSLGKTTDTSFVSTPAYYAGASAVDEFVALYLVGCA